jgi:hypothetical protein
MNLKQFKGPKTLETIKGQCMVQALICHSAWYETGGADHIVVFSPKAPEAKVLFAPVSGRFFGTDDTGAQFDSSNALDDQPWFAALLDFFLEPFPAGAEPALDAELPACRQLLLRPAAGNVVDKPQSLAAL